MLITDFQVIKGAEQIMIAYPDGEQRWATVRTCAISCDLAILDVQNPRADQNWLNLIDDSAVIPPNFYVYTIGYQDHDHPATPKRALATLGGWVP